MLVSHFGSRPFIVAALALAIGCSRHEAAAPQPPAEPKPAALATKGEDTPPASGSCEACRARYCSDYQRSGVNLVEGCGGKPDPKLAPSVDPKWAADCNAAVQCAIKNRCGYIETRGPAQCYCGSAGLEVCLEKGPAEDAACVAEWKAATRSEDNKEILTRFSELAYPSGWAFSQLECDRIYCGPTSKWGQCTPN